MRRTVGALHRRPRARARPEQGPALEGPRHDVRLRGRVQLLLDHGAAPSRPPSRPPRRARSRRASGRIGAWHSYNRSANADLRVRATRRHDVRGDAELRRRAAYATTPRAAFRCAACCTRPLSTSRARASTTPTTARAGASARWPPRAAPRPPRTLPRRTASSADSSSSAAETSSTADGKGTAADAKSGKGDGGQEGLQARDRLHHEVGDAIRAGSARRLRGARFLRRSARPRHREA